MADWERSAHARRAALAFRALVRFYIYMLIYPLENDDSALENDDSPLENDDSALENDDSPLENDDFCDRCLMKSPLIIGTDVRMLPAASMDILLNEHLIAVNQVAICV